MLSLGTGIIIYGGCIIPLESTWHDFFKVNGEFAVRNLTVIISMLVGSIVVIYMGIMGVLSGEIFGVYMLAGGGVYGFGKWQDEKTARSEIEAAAPPSPPPNTTINQPAGPINVAAQ